MKKAEADGEDQGTDEATRNGYEQLIRASHGQWWAETGPKRVNALFNRNIEGRGMDLALQPQQVH